MMSSRTLLLRLSVALVVLWVLPGAISLAAADQPRGPSSATAAPSPSTNELVGRIQKYYESTRDLHARFEQTLETGLGRKRSAAGEVWLKKPGRMRWDYQKPEKKLLVADGETLWVYEPEDQQAFRQSLSAAALPSAVNMLLGKGRFSDEFDISLEKDFPGRADGEAALRLVPRQATAQYRYLVFLVDTKNAMVTGTVIYDQQGGTNTMRFRDVERNRNLGDDKFQFTPPAGTRILNQ